MQNRGEQKGNIDDAAQQDGRSAESCNGIFLRPAGKGMDRQQDEGGGQRQRGGVFRVKPTQGHKPCAQNYPQQPGGNFTVGKEQGITFPLAQTAYDEKQQKQGKASGRPGGEDDGEEDDPCDDARPEACGDIVLQRHDGSGKISLSDPPSGSGAAPDGTEGTAGGGDMTLRDL